MLRAGCFRLGQHKPTVAKTSWVAHSAAVVGNVVLKEHSSVWFGVTIRGDNEEPVTIASHRFLTSADQD